MASGTETGSWPIEHITTGGGGAPLYLAYPHPALVAEAMTNHFVVFEATARKLIGRTYTTNDVLLDKFELTKREGQPASSYLARVYPEDLLKLSLEAASTLAGGLTALPARESNAQIMFNIPALKTVKRPVQLEISLAAVSAPYYKLAGAPLRITTPSATESNRVMWADLRAIGRQPITAQGRTKELSPPLVFQAKVLTTEGETLAYGQRCRVSDAAAKAAEDIAARRKPD